MTKTKTTLATFLLELSARAETGGLDHRTLGLHVRRRDLADHLGLTPGGLDRAFDDLVARGLVGIEPEGTVTILDRRALEHETSGKRVPTRERTESALRAILGDERFLSTPRTSALLVYLVEQALSDEIEPLDAARLSIEVLGKPSFDPADPTLRVLVTRLRKMLDEYDARTPGAPVSIRLERGALRVRLEPREP